MHKLLLAATLAAVAFGSVQAADDIEVSAQRLRSVGHHEFESIRGRYLMSDGRAMDIVRRGANVVVDLDGEERATVRAVDSLNLRSLDGRMVLRFTPAARGNDAVDVAVTLYRQGRVARVLSSQKSS
jgi:hypothetical protein